MSVVQPWLEPSPSLSLAEKTVDLWRFSIPDATQAEDLWRTITEEEASELRRVRIEVKQRERLVARAGLRKVLRRYGDGAPFMDPFSHSPDGKPYVKNSFQGKPIYFNVSHTKSMALIACCSIGELGVDVEYRRESRDWAAVAKRFFSPEEAKALADLPEQDRLAGFYQVWTSKEAYLKALGEGLKRDLDSFGVVANPHQAPGLVSDQRDATALSRWRFQTLPTPDHSPAVCVAPAQLSAWRYWDGNPLLKNS